MPVRIPPVVSFAICLRLAAASSNARTTDYKTEPIVIQDSITKVVFSKSGARQWHNVMSVRIQSEGGVRQLGVLSFSYAAATENLTVEYVRVIKPDGSVISTPESSIIDVTAEGALYAPAYTDTRRKQIPVRGLAVGDILEYSISSSESKPAVPDQFWYEHSFRNDAVVLSEILEVHIPNATPVEIDSPALKYQTTDSAAGQVYSWKFNQLEPSKPQATNHAEAVQPIRVRLTSFSDWEQVGRWWGSLASSQTIVTPAIQATADQITKSLSSDDAKARAIYKFVSLKFRYISVSFGEGRYVPHSADDILANRYGDCKDKHVLLVALLKAAGIEAWPALVGAGLSFDSTMPSPIHFNHVITVLPRGGNYIWLDSTQETAAFGLLNETIRDVEALVIPLNSKPFLLRTPANPPFASSETIAVKSSLGEDGSLTGRIDVRLTGDTAVPARFAFWQAATSQWQAVAQFFSFGWGFTGEASGVQAEYLDDLDAPLHIAYDYKCQKYSDWKQARIVPPLPPIEFGPGDEAEMPREPFSAGAPRQLFFSGSIALPAGFIIEVPKNVSLTTQFADYDALYSFLNGNLFASRKLVIKKSKVSLDQWTNYQKFAAALRSDQSQFLMVAKGETAAAGLSPAPPLATNSPADPLLLLQQAKEALEAVHDYNKAITLTTQANAIWANSDTKPPEYAESMVLLSLAKLADLYSTNGAARRGSAPSQWTAETANLLAAAVTLCSSNSAARPDVLALALELQALQTSDVDALSKIRGQAREIRRSLVQAIMPVPAFPDVTSEKVFRVTSEMVHPTLISKVEPTYTEAARCIALSGTTFFTLVIERDGTPSSVSMTEGLGFGLDEEAAKAVKQWRFHPGTLDGKPVRVQVRIEVQFKLI